MVRFEPKQENLCENISLIHRSLSINEPRTFFFVLFLLIIGVSKNKTDICVDGYESAWLNRWTRIDNNRDAKYFKEINSPEDGRASTGSMKLKGKMLSRVLVDLFPNPDSTVQSVETIPDMNKEPPIVVDRENSIDREDEETSSPATQSKNVEHFLNNTKLLLRECKHISESNSRSQVKRLKTNTSDCSRNETKSMMIVEEGPSGEKVNYFFHRIFGINNPGSSSISQIRNLIMGRGGEDANPWVQRWCKKKVAETHEPAGGQEVNQKGTALEKQFPSIAAMALMGKAMRGLNTNGLRKTNSSLFVWNAQDLRQNHSSF